MSNLQQAKMILDLLQSSLALIIKFEAILAEDPDVWPEIAADFTKTKKEFQDAINSRS